jgi:UDP-N-acetylmuramate dehydrogenase
MLNSECGFGYRDSVFKKSLKGKGVITSVEFRLAKKGYHKINTSYKPVAEAVSGVDDYSISDVANIIIGIRSGKLPNWEKIGTAGSFFKNPIVDCEVVDRIKSEFEDLPVYPFQGKYKLAAGWLIDQCGLKGREFGTIGVYKNQALVLVNLLGKGPALGEDLEKAISAIQTCVSGRFGIDLECEVNVIS